MNRAIREASVILVVSFFFSSQKLSSANDTLNTSQSIGYNQTLLSAMELFELGFFSTRNSSNWYLGIWYKNVKSRTVIWVANREAPLRNNSRAVLKVIEPGILVLLNDTNSTIWSSNASSIVVRNPILQLLDSGNLVLRDANDNRPRNYLWQSFDYPTDTYLPGMTLGLNSVYLTSWKSDEDPSPGEHKLYLDPTGYPQLFTTTAGVVRYRMGPWNGLVFSGLLHVRNNLSFTFGVHRNEEGLFYLRDDVLDKSLLLRGTLNTIGTVQRWQWVNRAQGWILQMTIPIDNCDDYNACGAYGYCTVGKFPICSCLDKFVPKDPQGWAESDWSTNGCVRRTPLNCTAGDGFVKYSNLKLPDARGSRYNETMTLEECAAECLRNCNCTAYTTLNITRGGSGCLMYFGDLVDMRLISIDDQDLYIRMAVSELDTRGKTNVKLTLSLATVGGAVLLGLSVVLCIWKRKKNGDQRNIESHDEDLELPLFDLLAISKATNGFSLQNKIGEGGYGPVYKGMLQDGQEIAVKRLSETSRQGLHEFKNEVLFIAKLQHRNLVKLLGCCIQGDEKMLIYEYMSNRSLDMVIFDQKNGAFLDWPTRLHIINGIARGLMYLHEDSRLRIIHRDLKASNILLDSEMNPKISDFGIAKTCGGNTTEDMTKRVVGTYGYMSPEYAVCGRFSLKSDVFSFGVMVLEIVSGKRNSSYSQRDGHLNLLTHAWTLHMEGRLIELVDDCLLTYDDLGEVLRLIHVGLLCVQQHPPDRPSITSVVAMLTSDSEMPQPNQPGYYTKYDTSSNVSSYYLATPTNEMTITMPDGR